MKNLLAAVLALFTLAACSTPPRSAWVKEGSTESQRVDALSQCQYEMRLNKIPAKERSDLLQLCMQGKGYRYRRVN